MVLSAPTQFSETTNYSESFGLADLAAFSSQLIFSRVGRDQNQSLKRREYGQNMSVVCSQLIFDVCLWPKKILICQFKIFVVQVLSLETLSQHTLVEHFSPAEEASCLNQTGWPNYSSWLLSQDNDM